MARAEAPFLRFHKLFSVNKSTDCWEWKSISGSSGYGLIKCFGKMILAHRFSYQLYKGDIPSGLEVLHSCDNSICVNPEHLDIGTHKENMQDMIKKGRRVQGKANPRKGIRSTQAKPVMVKGKKYGSMKEAERCLGVGSGTVGNWIKNNKAKYITREEYINGSLS